MEFEYEYPLITVIIPVLNNKTGLDRTICSLLNNNKDQLDLIIIDGGSIDGTTEYISSLNYKLGYWETGLDSGITNALNRGLSKAKGKFVACLNSGDLWIDNTYDLLRRHIFNYPDVDVFYGSVIFHDISTGVRYLKKPSIEKMKIRMGLFHPALLVKRDFYEQVGSYSEDYIYAMDSEWCHRALKQKGRFYEITKPLAVYQLGGLSDINFVRALWEYKRSVRNNFSESTLKLLLFFLVLVSIKYMLRIQTLKKLKQHFEIKL